MLRVRVLVLGRVVQVEVLHLVVKVAGHRGHWTALFVGKA